MNQVIIVPKQKEATKKKISKSKTRVLKFIGLQLAILTALIITQGVIQFASSYTFVGFVKKDTSTWIGVAMGAQVDRSDALQELEQCKKDKQAAVEAANPDLFN